MPCNDYLHCKSPINCDDNFREQDAYTALYQALELRCRQLERQNAELRANIENLEQTIRSWAEYEQVYSKSWGS
jgi:hypothetical protein